MSIMRENDQESYLHARQSPLKCAVLEQELVELARMVSVPPAKGIVVIEWMPMKLGSSIIRLATQHQVRRRDNWMIEVGLEEFRIVNPFTAVLRAERRRLWHGQIGVIIVVTQLPVRKTTACRHHRLVPHWPVVWHIVRCWIRLDGSCRRGRCQYIRFFFVNWRRVFITRTGSLHQIWIVSSPTSGNGYVIRWLLTGRSGRRKWRWSWHCIVCWIEGHFVVRIQGDRSMSVRRSPWITFPHIRAVGLMLDSTCVPLFFLF